jgi:CCR4-NOT transcription complex subunit 7/8
VNLLKIIQLGLTFSDSKGRLPKDKGCWQFNFKFSLKEDMYAQDSIDLLTNSGIDFEMLERDGIDVEEFGEYFTGSGIVLNPDVRWIAFHSGYDFGYLLKILTSSPIPNKEAEFFELLHLYFPTVSDIKYMMKNVDRLKGGLNTVAEDLQITRVGPAHQAGSDSLLTCFTYFKMMSLYFDNKFDDTKNVGIVYGMGATIDGGYTNEQTKILEYEQGELTGTMN